MLRLLLALLLALPAWAQPLIVAQPFLADTQDPVAGNTGWALQSHGVAETLFTVGRRGEVTPNLATTAERVGDAWRVGLLPGLRFSDGAPADAPAIAQGLLRALRENPRAAAGLGSATRIEATDPTTLLITPERPVGAIAPMLAEFPLVVARQAGEAHHFTGPWRVAELRRGDRLSLEPNPHYRDGATRPPVVIRRVTDPNALAIGLEAGAFDLAFGLAAENLPRLRARGIEIRSSPVAYQYMLLLNQRLPALADQRVRQALSLATDRGQLARLLGGGRTASGLFPDFMPWSLEAELPHDPGRAAALLDEAGWRLRDGLRRRGEQVLTITLTTYPQRPDFSTLAPLLRAQWEALGIRIRTEAVEAIIPVMQQGRFEAAFWTNHTAPGGDPAFTLEQYFRGNGPLNWLGAVDLALDATLDTLRAAAPDDRIGLARDAARRLNETVPAIFLLTPQWHVGVSARMAGYQPYPSDYYILHAR